MKVNILLNNATDVRSGYLNVDPCAPEGDAGDGRVRAEPHKLDLLDANECDEIVAHDALDFYQTHEVDRVLDHWLSKLAHGGTLTLSTIDAREVARSFLAGRIDVDEFNVLVHGQQDGPYRSRSCSLTMATLCAVLQDRGMQILSKRVADHRAVVTCRRP